MTSQSKCCEVTWCSCNCYISCIKRWSNEWLQVVWPHNQNVVRSHDAAAIVASVAPSNGAMGGCNSCDLATRMLWGHMMRLQLLRQLHQAMEPWVVASHVTKCCEVTWLATTDPCVSCCVNCSRITLSNPGVLSTSFCNLLGELYLHPVTSYWHLPPTDPSPWHAVASQMARIWSWWLLLYLHLCSTGRNSCHYCASFVQSLASQQMALAGPARRGQQDPAAWKKDPHNWGL